MEDFQRALEACDQVFAYQPDERLKAKTGERMATLRGKLPGPAGRPSRPVLARGPQPAPGPGQPVPQPGMPPGPYGPPPGQNYEQSQYYEEAAAADQSAAPGPGEYRWAIGGSLGAALPNGYEQSAGAKLGGERGPHAVQERRHRSARLLREHRPVAEHRSRGQATPS